MKTARVRERFNCNHSPCNKYSNTEIHQNKRKFIEQDTGNI